MRMNSSDDFIMRPKVDFCFKELMSDAEVRRGFIAALLNLGPKEIVDTELLPTHLNRQYKDDKEGILDVRVKLNGSIQIDVEMQVIMFTYWAERSLYYLSKMFTDQLRKGQDYEELQKCIHVGILDFELFESEEFYSRFHMWEDSRRELYSEKLEIHILELPKLVRFEYPQTEILSWARFFNGEEKEELKMLAKSDEYVQRAYDKLVDISADEEKRLEYEAREKAIRDYNNIVSSGWVRGCEQGRKDGFRQGRLEGQKEGRKEGRQEGIKVVIEVCQEELKLSKNDTAAKVVRKFSISEDEAENCVEKYWKSM